MDSMNSATWRKSTYSGGNGGGCIEVGKGDDAVAVRDTRDRAGAVLKFAPQAWAEFTKSLKKLAAGPEAGRSLMIGRVRPLPEVQLRALTARGHEALVSRSGDA